MVIFNSYVTNYQRVFFRGVETTKFLSWKLINALEKSAASFEFVKDPSRSDRQKPVGETSPSLVIVVDQILIFCPLKSSRITSDPLKLCS